MKSGRQRSRSLTKPKLIEENERLREGLARAQGPGLETSGTEEAERLRRELVGALEQQTATAEILRVISSSPTDVQPVFDVIAENAARLCEAQYCFVYRFEGQLLHFVAHHGLTAEVLEINRRAYPIPPSRKSVAARAVLERSVVQIPDVNADPDYALGAMAAAGGYRSATAVPILRDGLAIGSIAVTRAQAGLLPERQIALLKIFADQAVIAIENVRLFKELEARNSALAESLEQQTATAEILRAISSSPTDLQPVFSTIAGSATRLCDALYSLVFRFDGETITLVADDGASSQELEVIRSAYPAAPGRRSVAAQAILERRVIAIADAQSGTEYPHVAERAKAIGYRSVVSVPMLRGDTAIGAINVVRVEALPFSDTQIELLKTFADQAVIAVENVRLFKELEARNRDLAESLEQQTATGEILRVISSSPTNIQPVLDAVAESAKRLCEGYDAWIGLREGEHLRVRAHHGPIPIALELRQLNRGRVSERAVVDRQPVHVHDLAASGEEFPLGHADAVRIGHRTTLGVPLLREGEAIGVILTRRREVRPFTDKQIALLQTFADQAVIAIENVRLFTELQSSNRELKTALDTQTATSDILRVISRSQTDVQPVFAAILDSAVRLLRANTGVVTRLAGDQIELAAFTSTDDTSDAAVRATYPMSLRSERPIAQAVRDRAPVNIADAHTDPRVPEAVRAIARVRGYQSRVAVPLLRHDEAVGAISLTRREPGGFTDDEIALLQTFADQAVIAIENARLLTELHARTAELTQSVGELRALGEVGQVISSTLDLQTVLGTIVARATQLAGADAGVIYEYDAEREVFEPRATEHLEPEIVEVLVTVPVRKGEGATGQLAISPEAVQLPDIQLDSLPSLHHARGAFVRAGYRALLAVPLLREDHLIGSLTVVRKMPGEFPRETIDLLQTFATQSALAVQNARLFREIEDKSRQLEAASQHKSEFLANMSHELRTPLNAIIGFSEVLSERMFGDLNEKQEEYLKDIHASGQHLLSLINDILDLSKIEAGRMELELSDFHLPTALDSAVTLVRERAGRRSITLRTSVDERLGEMRADERKVRQVVLNLLSNAIKFTPEGGRIEVAAVPKDEVVEVSVSDTGVGIAPEDQEAVFEEFRQVGTADKKVEGTGLGLTLCRKFVELHGGRIWVKSRVGAGSTFTFTIPARAGE